MKSKILLFLTIIASILGCKSQVPPRPELKSDSLDKKLVNLLSFSVPIISVDELKALEGEYYLLDVRENEEYECSHLPGAMHWDNSRFSEILKGIDYDETIIVYCSVGYRSEKLGRKLQNLGYNNVKNLYGSIFEWINRGYSVVNSDDKTVKQIHTYNRKWSEYVVNPDYKLIW